MPEIVESSKLIDRIWGPASGLPTNMIRAIQHAGGYVAGAFTDGELVGTSVAIRGRMKDCDVLHSHITGVRDPGHGVGCLLKQHQRSWCRDQKLEAVTWTFDPLVARNGWFNLTKLGAVGLHYLPDHYGSMDDPINRGDATDRILAWWPAALVPGATATVEPATLLLGCDDLDRPVLTGIDPTQGQPVYAVTVPPDVDGLRAATPHRAAQWRTAVRATMGAAMGLGYAATAMPVKGVYHLRKPR